MHTIATRCRHLWKPALLAAAFGLVLPVSSTAAQQQKDDGRSQLRPGFEMPSQYLVTVTLYEIWPAHPKLNFDVGQPAFLSRECSMSVLTVTSGE